MESGESYQLARIQRRLDVLIALQLDQLEEREGISISAKVRRLLDMGLSPAEVASIVGKPVNYVTAIKSARTRTSKKKVD